MITVGTYCDIQHSKASVSIITEPQRICVCDLYPYKSYQACVEINNEAVLHKVDLMPHSSLLGFGPGLRAFSLIEVFNKIRRHLQ